MAAGGFVKIDPGLGAPARAYGRKHAGVSDADLGGGAIWNATPPTTQPYGGRKQCST